MSDEGTADHELRMVTPVSQVAGTFRGTAIKEGSILTGFRLQQD